MDNGQSLPLGDLAASLMPSSALVAEKINKATQSTDFAKVLSGAANNKNTGEDAADELNTQLDGTTDTSAINLLTPLPKAMISKAGGNELPLQRQNLSAAAPLTNAPSRGVVTEAVDSEAGVGSASEHSRDTLAAATKNQAFRTGPIRSGDVTEAALNTPASPDNKAHVAASDVSRRHTQTMEFTNTPLAQASRALAETPAVHVELPTSPIQRFDLRRERTEALTSVSATSSDPLPLNGILPQPSATPLTATTSVQPGAPVLHSGEPLVDSLGEKIIWLSRQDNQQATLQLKPLELGAVEIRVSISNAAAQIEIHAQQSDTGDLIESMLPKLQQSLEQQGLKLDDVKMSSSPLFADNNSAKSAQQEHSQRKLGASMADDAEEMAEEAEVVVVSRGDASIDAYA